MGRRRCDALGHWRLEGTPTHRDKERRWLREKGEAHGAHSGSAV
jgi:hypothetical protein